MKISPWKSFVGSIENERADIGEVYHLDNNSLQTEDSYFLQFALQR
jgi:hypothetical protein